MSTIGFIGLGHMGAPMAKNLLKNNFTVWAYDISNEAVADLVKNGAHAAESLDNIIQYADIIITMLPTGEHVQKICLGTQGLFAKAKPNTLFIDSSSIAVDTARELHQAAQAAKLNMIDAPVSGGVAAAEAGTLTFMVGGSEEDFNLAKPILEKMGKAVIHAGAAGTGQAAKICNNMILGISMIAVAEAFMLGKKLGLEPEKFFEISSKASGQCWSMTSYCPVPGIIPNVPANRDYSPGFTTAMMLKDLRLSQTAAQKVNASTPLGAEATALYTLFSNQANNSQLDFSAIIKFIE